MTEDFSHSHLENELRKTPVPPELKARLRKLAASSAELTDAQLDAEISAVAVPLHLADSLRYIVTETAAPPPSRLVVYSKSSNNSSGLSASSKNWTDEQIDAALRNVSIPPSLKRRITVVPQLRRRKPFRRLAAAAILFVAVSISYLATVGGLIGSLRPQHEQRIAFLYDGPLELHPPDQIESPQELLEFFISSDEESQPVPETEIALADFSAPSSTGPIGEFQKTLREGLDLSANTFLMQVAGARPQFTDDQLPQLDLPLVPFRAGVSPPLVRGFDRMFLLRHGVNPRVSPAAHVELAQSFAPLTQTTASYDAARQKVKQGRLPAPGDIRVEDFLAALEYGFPPPSQSLGLRTAAGPSLFRGGDALLLQTAVQATPQKRLGEPVHITILCDISASMNWGGRLEMTRRALYRSLAGLGPADRVSFIAFHQQAFTLAERVPSEQCGSLLAVFDSLHPEGGTNLGAALPAALSLALTGDETEQRKLILLTDGGGALAPTLQSQLGEMLAASQEAGLSLHIFDLSDQPEPDFDLTELADRGKAVVSKATDSIELTRGLRAAVFGKASSLARDVSLRIQFNPRAVRAYRLLGHEPSAGRPLSAEAASIELFGDECATTLYELWLYENNENQVATAELHWTDPAGRPHTLRQRISRLQFAPSFAETAPSLQMAAVAAEAAEVLRGSVFSRSRSQNLQQVLAAAPMVNTRVANSPAFAELVNFLESAQRVQRQAGGR